MITKFKLFENNYNSVTELADILNDDVIEDYFKKNYEEEDVEELVSLYPSIAINNLDDDSYVKDWIDSDIEVKELNEFNSYDIKNYIKNHLTDDKINKIIELYKENESIEDIVSKNDGEISILSDDENKKVIVTSKNGKSFEYEINDEYEIVVSDNDIVKKNEILAKNILQYDDYMLDVLDDDQIIEVVEYDYDEYECKTELINDYYKNMDAKDIIEDMCGDISNIQPKEFYNIIQNYLNEKDFLDEIKEGYDFEYKKEFIENYITTDKFLQNNILEADPKNVIMLASALEDNYYHDDDISQEYDFQKMYIEQYVKEESDEDSTDTDIEQLKAEAIKYLYDNFELNSDIEEEYKDSMIMVSTDKFNL